MKQLPGILQAILSVVFYFLALPFFLFYSFIRSIIPWRYKSLRGKTILITGAGNGLGREIAHQLFKNKCKVICVDLKKNDVEETAQMVKNEYGDTGGDIETYVCDISDKRDVTELRDKILQKHGKIDILINNAAMLYVSNLADGEDRHIIQCVNVNLLGTIWMTRAFLPSMKEEKSGTIIFTNSIGALMPTVGMNVYCLTKAAISSFARSLREELFNDKRYRDITICSAYPTIINTNEKFSQLYRTKMFVLSKEFVAKSILDGARRGAEEFMVPGGEFTMRTTILFNSVFPSSLARIFGKLLGTRFGQIENQNFYDQLYMPHMSHRQAFESFKESYGVKYS